MQILPTQRHQASSTLFSAFGQDNDDTQSFMEELLRQKEAVARVANDEAVSVQDALANMGETNAPLATAPYTVNTSNGVTYELDEVSFTQQELQDLHRDMQAAGAPAENLEDLRVLAEQPDGATLSQVVAAVQQIPQAPNLTEDETGSVSNLLNTIDPSGALAEKALPLLQQGRGREAWKEISTALKKLPGDTMLDITREEIAAIGKALGLSEGARGKLMGNFGSGNSASVSAFNLDRLFTPAHSAFMEQEQNKAKLDKAMQATLQPLLTKARGRMEQEKAANELKGKRVAQSEALIHDTVTRKATETLNQAHAAQAQDTPPQQPQDKAARENLHTRVQQAGRETGQHVPGQGQQEQGQQEQGQQFAQDFGYNARQNFPQERNTSSNASRDKADTPWGKLLGKLEVRGNTTSTTSNTASGTPLFGAAMNPAADASAPTASKGAQGTFLRQAVSQVEQAVLSAARDGSKRMDVQLNAAELGTLNLTLVTRNGEVSAIIRSEKGETADLLARQLDIIRTNLEQQGIKVDKLEVQQQGANNDAPQWDGMSGHNARQEESARRETLERLRNLRSTRNTLENDTGSTLERSMQYNGRAASGAGQGISIVA